MTDERKPTTKDKTYRREIRELIPHATQIANREAGPRPTLGGAKYKDWSWTWDSFFSEAMDDLAYERRLRTMTHQVLYG